MANGANPASAYRDFRRVNLDAPEEPRSKNRIITLSLTQQCNLNCVYCYQAARRDPAAENMPFEVARQALEEELTQDLGFETVTVELIGGEVFLRWPLAKRIIEWLLDNEARWTTPVSVFIDTNGTILTDEIKLWLYARRDKVIVGLSLDGTPSAQNLNRSDSYARVAPHIPFFARTWPTKSAKMTISPATIPMIHDSILHVMGSGLRVAANLPLEDIWGEPAQKAAHLEEFQSQIERLVEFFGSHPELPVPSIIDLPVGPMVSERDRGRSWCGAGRNMIAVESDGTRLPCNRYDRMSFDQGLFARPKGPLANACADCVLMPACPTCEAHNWETNGHPGNRTSFHCEFIKIQLWGTAQMRSLRIGGRLRELADRRQENDGGADIADEQEARKILDELRAAELILAELEAQGMVDADGRLRRGWARRERPVLARRERHAAERPGAGARP